MKSILLLAILSFSFVRLSAQCESDFTLEDKKYFDELVKQAELDDTRGPDDIIIVPVVFYIETYNGSPVYNASNLSNVINQNNAYFAPANVELSICTTILFENGTNPERIDHVIRVMIKTSYSGCGVSYGGGNITINPNCSRPFKEILGHEIGHDLGLPHTHGYTNMGTTTELVDGSNCTTDGDRFCDTPADPNILYEVNGSCIYTGTRTDANGDFYDPDTHNLMSYARGGCQNHFSAEQNARVHSVAEAKAYYCCLTPEPEADDVSVCSGSSATFSATISVGSVRWYDAPGGNLLYTGNSYTTPVLNSSKSYFLVGYDGCESDPIKVSANVLPGGGVMTGIAEKKSSFSQDSVNSYIYDVFKTDTLLYVTIGGSELWTFDGTPGSELLIFDVGGGDGQGGFTNLSSIAYGDYKILIGINDQNNGPSLWVSDGTAVGKELLYEWDSVDYRYSNFWITAFNDHFIFELTRLPDDHAEIWISDGTIAGTQLLIDLPETSSYTDFGFYEYNGKLYFKAADAGFEYELWSTDGTTFGTQMVVDINPTGSSNVSNLIEHEGWLYFGADDGVNGAELWKTDGTPASTSLVADINPDGYTYFSELKSIGSYLYFSGYTGSYGSEPYRTDGTAAGTELINDISPGIMSSSPIDFIECNGSIYFLARSVQGELYDLFKYLPGVDDLILVKEFNSVGWNSSELLCFNNELYFSSANEPGNIEPWVSDGTESGTFQWLDLNPQGGSNPNNYLAFKDQLFFVVSDSSGQDFWSAADAEYYACNGETVSISTQNQTGTVSWYDSPTGGVLLGTGYDYQSDILTNNISFWADLTIDGCSSERTEIPVAVTTINLNADITHELNTADGNIDLTVSGGIPPFIFDWDVDGTGDFDDEEDLSGLVPGSYEVSVVDSGGCIFSTSFEVFSLPQIIVDQVIDVDCFGSNSGSIELSIDGGTAPFVFDWDNGADTEDIFDLVAGEYTLTLTDANGFNETVTVLVSEPDELLAVHDQIQQISCNGMSDATIALIAEGGVEPYSYSFNGGVFETENTFSNLGTGAYSFEVLDANDCSFSGDFEITQPDELLASSMQIQIISCNGESDAVVEITVQGGTPPFEYSINGEGFETSNQFENMGAGDHTYSIMDANGCLFGAFFNVIEPGAFDYSLEITNEDEPGNGSIDLTVNGGTQPYIYDWDNDGTGDYDDTQDLEMLVGGNYSVSVLDLNNCELLLNAEVESTVSIKDESDLSQINVFPNPTSGIINIDFGDLNKENIEIRVYNSLGEVVYSMDNVSDSNLEVDLNTHENGVYLIKIHKEEDLLVKQIIKQ